MTRSVSSQRSKAAKIGIALLVASPIVGGLIFFRTRLINALESQALENEQRAELSILGSLEQNLALVELQISALAADSDIFLASKSVLFANNAIFLMESLKQRNALITQIALQRENESALLLDETIPSTTACTTAGWKVDEDFAKFCAPLRGYGESESFIEGGTPLSILLDHVQRESSQYISLTLVKQSERPESRPIPSLNGLGIAFTHNSTKKSEQIRFEILWLSLWIGASFACLMFLMTWLFRTERKRLQLEYEKTQKELLAIRARLNPHFLFNALNSIVNSIELSPKQGAEMAANLATLYRMITESTQFDFHPLEAELRIVNLYLKIEKIRFGDRLAWQIQIDDSHQKTSVPTLSIQLLVENAIKHGIAKSRIGGEIFIYCESLDKEWIRLVVKNSGTGLKTDFKDGTGLSSLRATLRLLHGERTALALGTSPDGLTEASFAIPKGDLT